jgi:crotonobetainyl-CoA:carnitine CoA-transferase CaiB-like acyl-CoA transferase
VPGALDGYRIIDITSILLGPYASQLLGDMGADVIKVEAPPKGDPTRYLGEGNSPGMSGMFLNVNRNKRSIVLDLKQQGAKAALRELIAGADVLIHNMRARAIAGLGFAYDDVVKIKPDIIYCGAYGYSQAGPKKDLPAYDDLIQAASGLSDLFEPTTGEPRYAPTALADKLAGLTMANAVTTALLHRERSGEGQFVEVPMYETMAAFLTVEHLYQHAFRPPKGPLGYLRIMTPLRRPNKAKDGYVAVLPYTDKQWWAFLEAAGYPELKQDPRFKDHTSRNENVHEIYDILSQMIATKSVAYWVALCEKAQIPVSPVVSLEDVINDPHIKDFGLFEDHEHPSEGPVTLTGMPVTFSKSPGSIRTMAPRFGENGVEVLREAGLDDDAIAALLQSDALITPDNPIS